MRRVKLFRLRLAKHTFAVAAACSTAFFATPASATNLITNGSFETGDLTGWSSNTPCGCVNPFGTSYGSGMDGQWWHWLAGYETQITTSQTVNGLTPGQSYTLSFIMASEYVHSDQLSVSLDGGLGTIFTAPPINANFWDNWVKQSLTFVASGTSENIAFSSDGLNATGYDVGLDNVTLQPSNNGAVPEPATWAMMLVGFGGIGLAARRSFKRKGLLQLA